MKYRIFISSVQREFAREKTGTGTEDMVKQYRSCGFADGEGVVYSDSAMSAGRRSERYHSGSAFDHPDQIYYDYNNRSELTNAIASVDESYNFSYSYDDIGNRIWSLEDTSEVAYSANNLNQYTSIDAFTPQYDADGNQTLIKTSTGVWTVTYNGENRPIYWSNGVTNIVMSFDRMGRRVQYLETAGSTTNANNTFTYDNYLCIARHREQDYGTIETDRFIWDPTEPTATRPLVFNYSTASPVYYTHDGNKNVSELVDGNEEVVAHYEYEAFGAVCVKNGAITDDNPMGFSSEYNDDVLGLVYYNYRHYDISYGKWVKRDVVDERGGNNLYGFCNNNAIALYDINGEAYFAVRSLKGVSSMMQGDNFSGGDRKNVEVLHEHLFFQDGKQPSNIGFGDEGIFFEDSFSGYHQTSGGYDDCIMRLAVASVSTPLYSLVGNLFLGFGNKYNCQDYAQELRAKYQELRNDKEALCKCKKRR